MLLAGMLDSVIHLCNLQNLKTKAGGIQEKTKAIAEFGELNRVQLYNSHMSRKLLNSHPTRTQRHRSPCETGPALHVLWSGMDEGIFFPVQINYATLVNKLAPAGDLGRRGAMRTARPAGPAFACLSVSFSVVYNESLSVSLREI